MKRNVIYSLLTIVVCVVAFSCSKEDLDVSLSPGNRFYQRDTAFYRESFHIYRGCDEKSESFGDVNGVEYVDLGLPSGTLWAKTNLEASSAEQDGGFYAWGELDVKERYTSEYYKWILNDNGNLVLTKYMTGYPSMCPDGLFSLEMEDDAARQKLGGSWRIPMVCDWTELLDHCTSEWCEYQGTWGYKLSAANGEWIFLPATGMCKGTPAYKGEYGCYWSTAVEDMEAAAFVFSSSDLYMAQVDRSHGASIRAVCPVKR